MPASIRLAESPHMRRGRHPHTQKSVFRRCDVGALQRKLGLLDACAVGAQRALQVPLAPTSRDELKTVVLSCRMSPISSNAGSKRPGGWPYSGPRAARTSGVNAGGIARALPKGPARQDSRSQAQEHLPRSTGAAP